MNPSPSPSPNFGKMPTIITALAFDLCGLYYCTIVLLYYWSVPNSSPSSKNTGKEGDCKSNNINSITIHCICLSSFYITQYSVEAILGD
jgi:hypothetical protein